MAAEEIQVPVVEEQVANPAPVNPTIETEVPPASKEKKPTKPRKPRAPATHPPYIKMIQEAIISLKEKTGSSQYAITKFIEENHKDHIPPNFKKLLLFHLRKLTSTGKLIKVKNSYKIPAAAAKITKTKATSKPKPKVSVAKPKAKSLVKLKSMAVVKPNTKPPFSAKHRTKLADTKPKRKSVGKLKPVAKVA
ncbi:histone H1-like, partial [Phalaenopsis equestris]